MLKQFTVLISLSVLLSACDKGQKSLAKMQEDFKPVVEGPVTLDNLEQAQAAVMNFQLLHAAHPDKASGKKGAEIAADLKQKTIKVGDELAPLVRRCLDESYVKQREVNDLTDKMQKEFKKKSKITAFKEGECLAKNYESEFGETGSMYEVALERIEKVGDKSLLMKKLYQAREKAAVYGNWKTEMEAKPAAEENKSAREYGTLKIDCARATEIVDKFQAYAANIETCTTLGNKLTIISNLMAKPK